MMYLFREKLISNNFDLIFLLAKEILKAAFKYISVMIKFLINTK